jgi:hypothetical protein
MGFGKRKAGKILPKLKIGGNTGLICLADRVFENGEWQTVGTNIEPEDFRAIFDLQNAEIGWIDFPRGGPPDMKLVPVGQDLGEAPSKKHKQGVRIIALMSGETGPREFLSTASGVWNGLSDLHDLYLSMAAANPGKVPVVGIEDMREETTTKGSSFEPVFSILKFVDRPGCLPADGIPPAVVAEKDPVPTSRRSARAHYDDEIPF